MIGSKLQFQTKKCAPLNLPEASGGLKLFPWDEPRLGTGGCSGAGLGSVTAAGGQGMAEGPGRDTPGRAPFRAEQLFQHSLLGSISAVVT